MYSIIGVLVEMAQEAGVTFHFREEIKSINTHQGRVSGFTSDRASYDFDYVISDADVYSIPKLLGKPSAHGPQHDAQLSSSALIFYWGMKIQTDKLKLHNILFSKDYKHEFDCLFDKNTLSDDPTVYIFISSKEVPTDAPPGHENWFVMINAPRNNGQDWDELTTAVRKNIIDKIHDMLEIDVEKHLLFEHCATPETIEKNTGSYRGALYGLNSNSVGSAFRRHPNYLRNMKGLYFVGGSVHPGGGIPLCLASAKIVSDHFTDLKK
jgi:diapolycopene oxygenase